MNKNIRLANCNLHLIVGQAGSGKSTTLYNNIKNGEIEKPIILCSKWMLVRETQKRLKSIGINCEVRTIQSVANNVNNFKNILFGVKNIVLEEFSQINYDLLLSLVDKIEQIGIKDIYAVGDFLQNVPIGSNGQNEEYSPMRHILRQYLLGKKSNFFASIVDDNIYDMMIEENVRKIDVPEKLQTIFKSIDIIVLNKNYRNAEGVIIRNYQDMNKLILRNMNQSRSIYLNKIIEAASKKDTQIIVADWRQMQKINRIVKERKEYYPNLNFETNLYYDIRGVYDAYRRKYYIKIDNSYEIINGRSDYILNKDEIELYLKPTYAYVSDSIQGMEFENVLIVSLLDGEEENSKFKSWSNFHFNSLYTAMTRHKKNIDIAADELGMLDIMKASNKLPNSKKDMLAEEWLMYCIMNAPNCEIGWREYNRLSHFEIIEEYGTKKIYSIIGKDKLMSQHGFRINFNKNATHEIPLVKAFTFASLWEKNRQPDDFSRNERNKVLLPRTQKGRKSKVSIWIDSLSKEEYEELVKDISILSVRNFKEKYGKTKMSVEKYINV